MSDNNKYTVEDVKNFGLWLGVNIKKAKGQSIDELFDEWKVDTIVEENWTREYFLESVDNAMEKGLSLADFKDSWT